MAEERHVWTDHQVEQVVGNILRGGVLLAGVTVLLGAVLYLRQEGHLVHDYAKFKGEPPGLRTLSGIVGGAVALEGKAVIQLGILLLLATPVARVIFSAYAFAAQRDWFYLAVTLFVLAVLALSLLGFRTGHGGAAERA